MTNNNYQTCEALRTVPDDKVQLGKKEISSSCPECSIKNGPLCRKCSFRSILLDRYSGANIPVDFWSREMDSFKGDKKLLNLYSSIKSDFQAYYIKGKSYCIVGNHGTGKTFFGSCFLKLAAVKGYPALYTTMGDVVNVLVNGFPKVKFDARRELMMVSFLVLDEFDSRFIGSEAAAELFGRLMESILRIRLQNYMPTILISNNLDPTKALGEYLGPSVSSLVSGYMKKISVIGPDWRKSNEQ